MVAGVTIGEPAANGSRAATVAPGCIGATALSRNGVLASGETSRLSAAPPSVVEVCTRMIRGHPVPRETPSTLGASARVSGGAVAVAPVWSRLAALATASAVPVSASARSGAASAGLAASASAALASTRVAIASALCGERGAVVVTWAGASWTPTRADPVPQPARARLTVAAAARPAARRAGWVRLGGLFMRTPPGWVRRAWALAWVAGADRRGRCCQSPAAPATAASRPTRVTSNAWKNQVCRSTVTVSEVRSTGLPSAPAMTTDSGAPVWSSFIRTRPSPDTVRRQMSAGARAGGVPAPERDWTSAQSLTWAPVTEVRSAPPMMAWASLGVVRPIQIVTPSFATAVTLTGRSTRLSTDGSTTTTAPVAGVARNVALPDDPRWKVNQAPTSRSASPITVSAPDSARLATIDTGEILT